MKNLVPVLFRTLHYSAILYVTWPAKESNIHKVWFEMNELFIISVHINDFEKSNVYT